MGFYCSGIDLNCHLGTNQASKKITALKTGSLDKSISICLACVGYELHKYGNHIGNFFGTVFIFILATFWERF